MHSTIALVSASAFLVYGLAVAYRRSTWPASWHVFAAASGLFFLFSFYTGAVEGPLGFWAEHTRSFWGNQVWLDLLLTASVAWFFLVPRARAVAMNLPVWFVVIASTGSIGLLAMVARLVYLEAQPRKA